MVKKKDLIQKGVMSKPRCYIGFHGVQSDTLHRFLTCFDGTLISPTKTDVVKVKLQPTFRGNVADVIQLLCAANDSQFLKQVGDCLIFYKAHDEDERSGD